MQDRVEAARLKISLVAKALKPDTEMTSPPTFAELEGACLALREAANLLLEVAYA